MDHLIPGNTVHFCWVDNKFRGLIKRRWQTVGEIPRVPQDLKLRDGSLESYIKGVAEREGFVALRTDVPGMYEIASLVHA